MSDEYTFESRGSWDIDLKASGVLVWYAYTYSTEETLELIDALQQAVRKHEELKNGR